MQMSFSHWESRSSGRLAQWQTKAARKLKLLDPKAPEKTPLCMDGWHIIVEEGICAREILFGHLADVIPLF